MEGAPPWGSPMSILRNAAYEPARELEEIEAWPRTRRAARVTPISVYRGQSAGTFYRQRGKRLLDLSLATMLFLCLLPLMAVVALAVLLSSGWPVLYGCERAGKDDRPFRMWKFRTMVRGADTLLERWLRSRPELAAEYNRGYKLKRDPRVTGLGHFLRRSSLDELPQLWNVIRGDMSLVGPRPIINTETRLYGRYRSALLALRPGVTGTWQLNGRNRCTYPERMWVELEYCSTVGLAADARILVRTLLAPLRFEGV